MSEPTRRVFFALWPGPVRRSALAGWQPPLQALCGGRAMRADTLHVTLAFLGEVAEARLEALRLAAAEVAGQRFTLRLDLARYWGHNQIVYAAASHAPDALLQLATALRQSLRRHGFDPDPRAYQPHVTLLRHARWRDVPLPEPSPLVWPVRDFVLVESCPDAAGAHYRVLARFPLAAAK